MGFSAPFIDFHTHSEDAQPNVVKVISCDLNDDLELKPEQYYSVGIHPWNARMESLESMLYELKGLLSNSNFLAVGEIGLDRIRGERLEVQRAVLLSQLAFATEHHKPVIIHCVRAWDELLAHKKRFSQNVTWAIHGFSGNFELAKQLTGKGFYLSVGAHILRQNFRLAQAIKNVPVSKILVETDDSGIDIKEVYGSLAGHLGLSIHELKSIVAENFCTFFPSHQF